MNKYDKMIACNRKASAEKIDLARRTIFEMVEEGEKVTIPKLIAKTGLSRGFFYKNPMVRQSAGQSAGAAGRDDRPQAFGSGYGDG